jgi:mRNA interferase MazF
MVIRRGEIYWADLGEPVGSSPGYRHPVLIVQENTFNNSLIATVIILMLTSNPKLNEHGNVFIAADESGLPRDSIVNITQLATINKLELTERVGQLPEWLMALVEDGLKLVLGLKG